MSASVTARSHPPSPATSKESFKFEHHTYSPIHLQLLHTAVSTHQLIANHCTWPLISKFQMLLLCFTLLCITQSQLYCHRVSVLLTLMHRCKVSIQWFITSWEFLQVAKLALSAVQVLPYILFIGVWDTPVVFAVSFCLDSRFESIACHHNSCSVFFYATFHSSKQNRYYLVRNLNQEILKSNPTRNHHQKRTYFHNLRWNHCHPKTRT